MFTYTLLYSSLHKRLTTWESSSRHAKNLRWGEGGKGLPCVESHMEATCNSTKFICAHIVEYLLTLVPSYHSFPK